MVLVAGGTFQMGTDGGGNEDPAHEVTLSGFYMGKYEVTQAEYKAVMGENPSNFTGDNLPVEQVSWYDAVEYCNKLSIKEGLSPVYDIKNRVPASGYPITNADVTPDFSRKGYRLPTEAEWEYAARGGNKSGDHGYSGSDTAGEVAWTHENSEGTTHEVGKKAPNELALYDMSGNVVEWCWDWYALYPSGAETNPVGASSGSFRVLRGGCWSIPAEYARSAWRGNGTPSTRYYDLGFRVVRPQF